MPDGTCYANPQAVDIPQNIECHLHAMFSSYEEDQPQTISIGLSYLLAVYSLRLVAVVCSD